MNKLLFTPAALLDLLSSLPELSEYEVAISEPGLESEDGNIILYIGDSTYVLKANPEVIEVDESTIQDVSEVNEEAYEAIESDETSEPIESGILKELAKTLLLGGVIRLTKKLLS